MKLSQPTYNLSSLLCQESQSSLDHEEWEENDSILEEDDKEYVQILLNREINGNVIQKNEFANALSSDWIKGARLDAIHYIFRTGLTFGFKIQTVYLAVAYMDTFLSKKFIEAEKYWVVPLLAIACLSLAAKMEECKVPGLSQLPEKFYNFESKVIQRMELLVLDTLEWKMKLITPFAFIHYFVSKWCPTASNAVSKVIQVILKAIKGEMAIQAAWPSAIAAAATLFTLDQTLTKESLGHKINTLSCRNYHDVEEIFCLYNRLKEQEAKNLEFPNHSISPPLSPFQLHCAGALENSTKSPFAIGSKRKSLTFREGDQNINHDDNKRQC